MVSRKNEPDGTHFRSNRTLSINGEWFFLTRENDKPLGPFPTQAKAEGALERYIKDMKGKKSQLQAESYIELLKDNYIVDKY